MLEGMSFSAAALPPPRDPSAPYTVCLVCLGNICRSPMAEVVLRAELAQAGLAEAVTVDSAGTGDWHIGHPMDRRAHAELGRRGYDGSAHRARQIGASWLPGRDLFLAMDHRNLADLRRMAAQAGVADSRVRLFGAAGGLGPDQDIPDPYGGEADDFATALALIQDGARQLSGQLAVLLAGHAPA
jgi:low molecular weight protein-tyrosine phosphatase